jgi:fatty acid desaturase
VLTSSNVRSRWFIDLLFSGLDHQIEHQLFPVMPRGDLRTARADVRAHCSASAIICTEPIVDRLARHLATAFARGRRAVAPSYKMAA